RPNHEAASMRATRGGAILVGALGNQMSGSTTLTAFFEALHRWYGDTPALMAPLLGHDHRESDICGECDIPIPAIPGFGLFDLGLSHPTYYQSVNVFSPLGSDGGIDPLFASL